MRLTFQRRSLLEYVNDHPGVRNYELAHYFGVTPASISIMMRRLYEEAAVFRDTMRGWRLSDLGAKIVGCPAPIIEEVLPVTPQVNGPITANIKWPTWRMAVLSFLGDKLYSARVPDLTGFEMSSMWDILREMGENGWEPFSVTTTSAPMAALTVNTYHFKRLG